MAFLRGENGVLDPFLTPPKKRGVFGGSGGVFLGVFLDPQNDPPRPPKKGGLKTTVFRGYGGVDPDPPSGPVASSQMATNHNNRIRCRSGSIAEF